MQLDCRGVTAPPPALQAYSYDWTKKAFGGGGTLSMDGQRCHLTAPVKNIETRLVSVDNLAAGDVLMLADVVPTEPVPQVEVGFKYGCDTTNCLYAYIWTPDSTIQVWDGGTNLAAKPMTLQAGTNRLMLAIHQNVMRVWLNGQLIATGTAARTHGAGPYVLFMENWNTTGSISVDVLQFDVFRLA